MTLPRIPRCGGLAARRVRPRILSTALALLCGLPVATSLAASYTWTSVTGNWSVGTNWVGNVAPSGADSTDILLFAGNVGTTLAPTNYTATNNVANPFILNELRLNATDTGLSGLAHILAGSALRLSGTAPKITADGAGQFTINTAIELTGATTFGGNGTGVITLNQTISGAQDITKTGTSIFRFGTAANGVPSANTWMGNLTISGGTIRFNNNADSGRTALRSNAVSLAAGTFLTVQSELRVGVLSGAGGTVEARDATLAGNLDGQNIVIYALKDGSFAGTIRNRNTDNNAGVDPDASPDLVLRGTGTQTFTGSMLIEKDVYIGGSATMVLAGTASLLVTGSTSGAIILAGGNFRIDNTAGNVNRLRDSGGTGLDTSGGGTFTLRGNASGSTEVLGRLQLGTVTALSPFGKPRSGALNVVVEDNSATATPTVLAFTELNRQNASYVADNTKHWLNQFATVNFVGTGGTLGATLGNPRVTFSTAPATQATGSTFGDRLLRNTDDAGNTSVGWATVDGTRFAVYDPTNGIEAVTTAAFPIVSTPALNAFLDVAGAITTNGAFALNSLTLAPNADGLSLSFTGTGSLNTTALLLAGTRDFGLVNSGGNGTLSGGDTRYVHVQNEGVTLSINVNAGGSVRPLVKSGLGTLSLGSTANAGGNFTTVINSGVVRATPGSTLPGGELRLRGGVFEIVGGTFTRTLGHTTGTLSWSGFDPTANLNVGAGIPEDRGSGGFAAFGVDATVDLNAAGATNIAWEDRFFVNSGYALIFGSKLSDKRVTWVDNISLAASDPTANYNAREFRVIDNPNSTGDSAQLSGIVSGVMQNDLLKTGTGTLALSNAANTYTGATLIQEGTLLVNGSIGASFLTETRGLSALRKATLGGKGTTGAVRIADHGVLAPGDSAANTSLLVTGNLTFTGATSFLDIQIGGALPGGDDVNGYDQIDANGSLLLAGAQLTGSLLHSYSVAPGQMFFLIDNDGADAVQGTFAQGSSIVIDGVSFDIGYSGNWTGLQATSTFAGGNDVVLRAVPEPSSALFAGLGAFLLARRRRR